jgi:hypothetical protein
MALLIMASADETRFAIPRGAMSLLERIREPIRISQEENRENRLALMDADVMNLSTRRPILGGTSREGVPPKGRRVSRYTALQLLEMTVQSTNVRPVALSMKMNPATHRIWTGIRIASSDTWYRMDAPRAIVIPVAIDAKDAVIVSNAPIATLDQATYLFVDSVIAVRAAPNRARRMTVRSKYLVMAPCHAESDANRWETRSAA